MRYRERVNVRACVAFDFFLRVGVGDNGMCRSKVDADDETPGAIYRDSLEILLTYPDGSGGKATVTINPTARGSFSFSGVPVGNHTLSVIHLPDSDTTTYAVSVTPLADVKLAVTFPADLW